ncbi:MAG: hypothetical protein Q9223_001429 [Gallowayella weberi]
MAPRHLTQPQSNFPSENEEDDYGSELRKGTEDPQTRSEARMPELGQVANPTQPPRLSGPRASRQSTLSTMQHATVRNQDGWLQSNNLYSAFSSERYRAVGQTDPTSKALWSPNYSPDHLVHGYRV